MKGKKKKRADPSKGIECPTCKGRWVQYKKSTNSFWCRKCGTEFTATWIDPPKGKKA